MPDTTLTGESGTKGPQKIFDGYKKIDFCQA